MSGNPKGRRRLSPLWRPTIEIGFIIFLFYSNLLMGELESANQPGKSLAFALHDVITPKNSVIAISSALVGYILFEYLRKKF